MDSSSIRGRFSLSTTNLSTPIAESTCLNGLSSRSKFNWGEGTISPRNRNNSHSVIEQGSSMSKHLTSVPTKVSMSPSSRIDPRTYVDIHSNGLASRIVKYHDNSSRLNRSLSMTNLYNKPGQFPVVHLKKNEQQYKAKKIKNLSMTRIAAPEKSVFHGNTLSSILRSGSIVGLQKSDEEISRENRPILHPPPTENEMAPTRSVLEVLKEISRKRINSDEMDGTELTKKQCKEPEQDSTLNTIYRTQSKRQREITNSSTSNAQISPEQQVIKKRMCNYNNDIMSSLSSSMASVNKRKMLEIQSQKQTSFDLGAISPNSASTDYEISRNDKLRCVGNFEMQNLDPPTKTIQNKSMSSTPYQNSTELDGETRNGIVTRRASEPALSNTKPKLTLFNKNYDEVPTILSNDNVEVKEDGDLCGIQFVKPKKSSSISSGGSLLMEKTKKSKLALMLSGLKGELDEEDEVDAVVSKQENKKLTVSSVETHVTSISSTPNSTCLFTTTTTTVTTTSQPSVTSKSVVEDSANKKTEITRSLNLSSIPVTSTSSKVSSGFKINPIPVSSTTLPAEQQVTVQTITTAAPISTTTSSTTQNPIVGGFSFGLNTPKTSAAITSSAFSSPPSSTISQANSSILTTSAPITLSATNSNTGIKSFGFGQLTTQPSVSSTPSFNFGTPTTTSQIVSITKLPAATSTFEALNKPKESLAIGQSSGTSLPTFNFGSLAEAKTTTNALTTEKPSPATSSVLTTNFDSQKNTWTTPSNSTPGNTNSINSIAVFGAGNVSNLPQSTTVLTSTNSTGGFSFSNSSITEAPKPLFGNIAPANTTSTKSNMAFSFSANKTTPNPTTTNSTFTFGTGALSTAAAAPNAASTFGTNVPPSTAANTALTFGSTVPAAAANSNPQNVFGNTTNPNAKPSNTFTFGSSGPSAPSQNGVFAFSSTDKTSTTIPAGAGSVGGFSFNNPSVNFAPVAETNKNIFGSVQPAAVTETKPAFNFGSSSSNPSTDKPAVFGGATNIFGANSTSSAPQSSAFTFGSSSSETKNQGQTAANPFAPAPTSNLTGGSAGASTVSNSIFGAPPSAVSPLAQSSTFTFGASSSNTKQEASKPPGGFVFGSTSSIGSNASKPAVDLSKTFVFGDGNTIIKPAPSSTSVFGGNSATSSGINGGGVPDNKMFSFGSTAGGSNNTFAAASQTVNPAPAFNFGGGAAPTNNAAPAPNGNLFAQPESRPYKKATRRLHKT